MVCKLNKTDCKHVFLTIKNDSKSLLTQSIKKCRFSISKHKEKYGGSFSMDTEKKEIKKVDIENSINVI
mgnify:CR=1 FL=1